MVALRTILHPTDFSDGSRLAFELACALAREQGARLIVLHVKQPPGPMVSYGAAVAWLRPEETDEKLWAQLRQNEAGDAAVALEHRLLEGDPARVIVRLAGAGGCDLVVMGSHGRTGLSRLLLGSVAEEVVRRAGCPVVTVRAPRSAPPAAERARPAAVPVAR
jgi:nucleotide-binding universal stress UspA family protein